MEVLHFDAIRHRTLTERRKIRGWMLQLVVWSVSKEALTARMFEKMKVPCPPNFGLVLAGYHPLPGWDPSKNKKESKRVIPELRTRRNTVEGQNK